MTEYNLNETVGGGLLNAIKSTGEFLAKHHQVSFVSLGNKTQIIKLNSYENLEVESTPADGQLDSNGKSQENRIAVFNSQNLKTISNFLDKNQPEVIVVHFDAVFGYLALNWAKKNNKKVLYWSHMLVDRGHEFHQENKKILKLLSIFASRFLILIFCKQIAGVIAINNASVQSFRNIGYKGRVFVMPNARDMDTFNNSNNLKSFQAENLVFIGHISKRKNQEFLINSMKFIKKKYKLKLIGKIFEKKTYFKLKKIVEDNGLNVEFVDRVDYCQIPNILENTKLFLSASKTEVQSLVVLEAIASGIPIVALENETTKEFKEQQFIEVLPPITSPQDFARIVNRKLKMDEGEYLELSKLAKDFSENFSFENQEKVFKDIYFQINS
ncbi:MAG: glycosyltransferase [Spirulinaceae cyanobacterium]